MVSLSNTDTTLADCNFVFAKRKDDFQVGVESSHYVADIGRYAINF